MPRRTPTAALLIFLVVSSAWSQQQPPPSPCKTDPRFAEFDFWLGSWDVIDRATGRHAGVNRIEKVEQDCLILERWTGDDGGTGFSMNYHDPLTGKWRQLWVSAGAYSIDYSGGLDDDGAMVLEGKIHYYRTGKAFPFRGRWTPNEDGTVRQHFQQYDPDEEAWRDWFDARYERRGS